MRIRRCLQIVAELHHERHLDLALALRGQVVWRDMQTWQLRGVHLDGAVAVESAGLAVLQQVPALEWMQWQDLSVQEQDSLQPLLKAGLVYTDMDEHAAVAAAEDAFADQYWHPLSAIYHRHSRWQHADTVQAMERSGTRTAQELREVLGSAPPPAWVERGDSTKLESLPRSGDSPLEQLFAARVTCRNFDQESSLPLPVLATVLEWVFASRGHENVCEDTVFLKRSSPSGGGLHPLEAYVWAQRVEGLPAGLYHYRCIDHALAPMGEPEVSLLQALAGQDWFAQAPVVVVLTARFARNFWKYREHAKAYRALLLEAGHFSQSLYLAATEQGMGAWVTCAVNEALFEQALGLEPMSEGVLAVCGLGQRGDVMDVMELDPAGAIWQPASL